MTHLRLIQACLILCIATLGSCSNDTTIDINDGGAIRFASSVGRQSRANIDNIKNNGFQVWGIIPNPASDHEIYLNDTFWWNWDIGQWENADNSRKFWPDETLDFYALFPTTPTWGTVEISRNAQTITDYIAPGDEDLLYAATVNQTKAGHIAADRITFTPVDLNFYHALSQIAVAVDEVERSAIAVFINKITLRNVAKQASLTIPHSTTAPGQPVPETLWSPPLRIDGDLDYTVFYDGYEWPVTQFLPDPEDPTYINEPIGWQYVIPQAITPWQRPDGSFDPNGTYLEIDCRITNKVDGFAGNIQLWPKNNAPGYAPVAVSLSGVWKPGMKYTYTLIFGKGAGIDPNNPTESLFIPVSVNVSSEGIGTEDGDLDKNT